MSQKAAGLSLLSSIGASLCCLTPLLTLVSGASGIASRFSWIEPTRPYFIGLSVCLLAFAWYQKLRTQTVDNCGCAVVENKKFRSSFGFLVALTLITLLTLTFPFYAPLFYRTQKSAVASVAPQGNSIKRVEFFIQGMGCAACEPEVEGAVAKLVGVQFVKASCKMKNTVVTYDCTNVKLDLILQAIKQTGYTVKSVKH